MKRKFIWVLVSCLVATTLVLASCGGAEEEEEEEEQISSDEPQYGGEATIAYDLDVRAFDDTIIIKTYTYTLHLTNEELFQGDWARGPAGTGEVKWNGNFTGIENYMKTGVGEPWELDRATNSIIFQIRQGVYFHDKPPANGREMTADDVLASINRAWSIPQSFLSLAFPKPISVEKTGDWEVTAQFASWSDLTQTIVQIGNLLFIWPEEAIEQYEQFTEWDQVIGTGPYIQTDYVKDSSHTFVRNDNYWDVDPVGPGKGNQLPYLDGVKILIIPDASTRMSAIRTAKVDQAIFSWEDSLSLKQTNPEILQTATYSNPCCYIALRMDNPDLPWYDKSVRQAIAMSIDYQAIDREYYGGLSNWYSYPTLNSTAGMAYRIPFDELPQNIQDIYTYNPDKAKQMLADAGYSDGFDLEVICQIQDVDLMSIYAADLAKVGINMIIASKDPAVYQSIRGGNTQENAIYRTSIATWVFNMDGVRWPCSFNAAQLQDDYLNEVHRKVWDQYDDWDARCETFKEATPYILENAWFIQCPEYPNFTCWQPWVGNYHGEFQIGNTAYPNFLKWIWLDQDMKEEMTGQR